MDHDCFAYKNTTEQQGPMESFLPSFFLLCACSFYPILKIPKCFSGHLDHISWASLVAQTIKSLPAMWETRVRSLRWEDPLEKEMATHSSSILAWRIPRMEEPGGLQSTGSQRVGHDWATNTRSYIIGLGVPSIGILKNILIFTWDTWLSTAIHSLSALTEARQSSEKLTFADDLKTLLNWVVWIPLSSTATNL